MTAFQGLVPVAASAKAPLENRVWYTYPGQTTPNVLPPDGLAKPDSVSRVLDDDSTQASHASYNAQGNITQSVDPLGRTTYYGYDPTGIDVVRIAQGTSSGQQVLSSFTYNNLHLPVTVTDASQRVTTMDYSDEGQLLSRTVVVGGVEQTSTLEYDDDGYLESATGPVPGATTSFTYDDFGRTETLTDSEGYTLTNGYDALDCPVSVTYPDSTSDLTYYRFLNVTRQVDREGRSTRREYDAIGQLVEVIDPLGRSTKYTWCTCGGLSTLTDANGNITTWNLDLQGRITAKVYADSSQITFAYESATSRLHQMTDAMGSTAIYTYNADNTLGCTNYNPGTGMAPTPDASFTYDGPYKRLLTMTDGIGTTTYTYKPITGAVTTGAGHLTKVEIPIAGSTAVVDYTYDELERVTGCSIDGATTNANNASTTFDALGRVTGVTNALGSFSYAYVNETGRLASMTYPSGTGLSTVYSYFDNMGDQRLQTIQNLKGGSTNVSKFDYTYNPVGTITTWTQQADSATAVVNTLAYDDADQLTSATQSGGGPTHNYAYDPTGNRLAETTASGTTTGRFNNLNQLSAYSGSTTSQTVTGSVAVPASVTVNAVPATVTSGTNFSANVPLPNGTNTLTVVAKPTSAGLTMTKRFQTVTSGTLPPVLTYDANGNTLMDENGNSYEWDALNRLTAIAYSSGAHAGTHTEFSYDGLSRRVSIVERAGTTTGTGTISSEKLYLWIGTEIAEDIYPIGPAPKQP